MDASKLDAATEGIVTRTNAVNAGAIKFTAAFVGEEATNLDLIDANGDAKYYVDQAKTKTVVVSAPNRQATLTVTVVASVESGELSLSDALDAFYGDHTLTLAITVKDHASTGLQCAVKASSADIPVANNAFAASNGNSSIALNKTSFAGASSNTYTTYVGYWLLENGTSDDTSSPVGGEIDAVLTIGAKS